MWGVDEENGWAYVNVTVPPDPSSTQQEANSPAAGQVEITGRAQVGETLAANSVISDADGTSQASYAYQWLADGEEITGATGNTYELTAAQLGRRITLRVAFTDDCGQCRVADQRGHGRGGGSAQAQQPGHRSANHHRDGPGGRDADGGHVGRRRR